MDKIKSSVVDRAVIRGAKAIVGKCAGKRGKKKYTGKVHRANLLEMAALAIENEIRKNPEGFARYIVSRMAWDMVRDVHSQKCEVYMA